MKHFFKILFFSFFIFYSSFFIAFSQDSPFSLLKSARTKEAANDFKGMIEDCSKAISLKADFDSAYCLRGVAYLKTGDLKSASDDLGKAIKLNSKYADAYYARGIIKASKEDFIGAAKDFS